MPSHACCKPRQHVLQAFCYFRMLEIRFRNMLFCFLLAFACSPLYFKACSFPVFYVSHASSIAFMHAAGDFPYSRMPVLPLSSMQLAVFHALACLLQAKVACTSGFLLFPHARRGASRHAIFEFSLPYMSIALNKSIRIGQAPDALCFYVLFICFYVLLLSLIYIYICALICISLHILLFAANRPVQSLRQDLCVIRQCV